MELLLLLGIALVSIVMLTCVAATVAVVVEALIVVFSREDR